MIKRAIYLFCAGFLLVVVPFLIGRYLNFLWPIDHSLFFIWVQGFLELALLGGIVLVISGIYFYIVEGTGETNINNADN